jgi:SNF2 family DNA or RNA helicase
LIDQILRRGEQGIIFSAFNSSLDALAERLSAASVSHLMLDGRVKPRARGLLATQFKSGDIPIMLAGVDSMAEMHSFSNCSNCILLAYSWAWDKFEQAINRIHRINSPKPVNVYSIICDGTIERPS